MPSRFRHAAHVVRMASVFLAGAVLFLIARSALIPDGFGTFGFYRAGAIDDAKARSIAYAGSASCEGCHVGKYWSDFDDAEATAKSDPKRDNRHSVLRCESCHGPLALHASNQKRKEAGEDVADKPVPQVTADKLCLGCHREITGRPEFQPQVIAGDHGDKDKCESCHRPHRPRTDEDEQ